MTPSTGGPSMGWPEALVLAVLILSCAAVIVLLGN